MVRKDKTSKKEKVDNIEANTKEVDEPKKKNINTHVILMNTGHI